MCDFRTRPLLKKGPSANCRKLFSPRNVALRRATTNQQRRGSDFHALASRGAGIEHVAMARCRVRRRRAEPTAKAHVGVAEAPAAAARGWVGAAIR